MTDRETRQLPLCAACNKSMTFIDAVASPDGAIAIFRCSGCNKLFWEMPRRDQK
jgi:phage FluMu protein Com